MKNYAIYNTSGYADLTAYRAICRADRDARLKRKQCANRKHIPTRVIRSQNAAAYRRT